MDYEKKYKEALGWIGSLYPTMEGAVRKDAEHYFPELKESEDKEKPNGGIVLEDFTEGDGFYKVNLAYLSKEQVEEIETIVKKWNPELIEAEDERIIGAIKEAVNYYWVDDSQAKTDIFAWLEKQGEKEKFIKKELGYIRGYREEALRRLQELEKQGEQKPITDFSNLRI